MRLSKMVALGLLSSSPTYSDRLLNIGGAGVGAYWKLANTSGTTATDSTGNGFNGTESNVTLNVAGVGDGLTAARFVPASNSYVNVYSTALSNAWNGQEFSFTITFRMRAASVWTDGAFREIARFLVNASNVFSIEKYNTINTIGINYTAGGTGRTIYLISNSTDWITLTVTVSKSGDVFKAYANGSQVGVTQTGLGTWTGTLSSTRCVIGATSTGPTLVHDGDIAHARWLPGVVLTDAQAANVSVGTGRVIDLDGAVGANAVTYLTTPTYEGSGQAVHPSVVDFGSAWNGYRYWMAFTPFPNADATKENPSILVSNDGDTWIVPPGLTNPLDPAQTPPILHSDTELIYDGSQLWCIYREDDTVNVILYARSSSDGITWSSRTAIYNSTANKLLSPTIIWDGTQWCMYTVFDTTANEVQRQTSAAITGTWSVPTSVTLNIPFDEPWHIYILRDTDGTLFQFISTHSRSGMLCCSFDNGLTWVFGGTRVMIPSGGVGKWDEFIYRMSALKTSTGFDIWYSAFGGTSPYIFHIGRTTVPL